MMILITLLASQLLRTLKVIPLIFIIVQDKKDIQVILTKILQHIKHGINNIMVEETSTNMILNNMLNITNSTMDNNLQQTNKNKQNNKQKLQTPITHPRHQMAITSNNTKITTTNTINTTMHSQELILMLNIMVNNIIRMETRHYLLPLRMRVKQQRINSQVNETELT